MLRNSTRVVATTLAIALSVALAGCGDRNPAAPAGETGATAAQATPEKAVDFTITAAGLPQADGTQVELSGYLQDAAGKWTQGALANTTIQGGKFSLSGPMTQPLPGLLQIGGMKDADGAYLPLIIEKANYEVSAVDGVLMVKGGHYNELVYGYTGQPDYIAAHKAKDVAEAKAFAGIDRSDQKAMLKAKMDASPVVGPHYMALGKIAGDYLTKVIEGGNDDLAKFYALNNNSDGERYTPEKRKALMAGFGKTLADNPEYKNMLAGAEMEAQAAAANNAMSKGKPYRDISVADKDGREVKLSEALKQNKLVLVDFWASWCAPCREDFPFLAKVYRDYHDAGFEIYAVSLDEGREDWLKALKQESDDGNVPWINLRAQGFGSEAAQAYGVMGLPSSFLIGSDGTILGKDMHKQEIGKVVSQQLKQLGKGKG